jgi:hypothetical protein
MMAQSCWDLTGHSAGPVPPVGVFGDQQRAVEPLSRPARHDLLEATRLVHVGTVDEPWSVDPGRLERAQKLSDLVGGDVARGQRPYG